MFYTFKKFFPQRLKNIYHHAQAALANVLFLFPSQKLIVIGITGTNGKTTTTHMVGRILEAQGIKTAVASTIAYRINGRETINKTKFTTASSFSVQKFLRRAVKRGCTHAVLEVSSHALDQNRLWGISFYVAVITNVTREHLDYHRTMEEYRSAKRKLFENAQHGVINAEMERPREFAEKIYGRCILYGKYDPGLAEYETLLAKKVSQGVNSTTFTVRQVPFELQLPGIVNVENALAAISVGRVLGMKLPSIAETLRQIQTIPGRMEEFPNKRGISLMIDYAVTPDALEKLYTLLRAKKQGKIIAVFGACGERDRGKRPIMGEIVDEFADVIILTNEDPYRENPKQIIDEVAKGIHKKRIGETFFKIMDRRAAIKKALEVARKDDIVVITGKGAEETMMIGRRMIPWNDRMTVEELLNR